MEKEDFYKLCQIDSTVNELESVFEFIVNNIGDVSAKRMSVDCDTESNIVNVCYLFSYGMMVSISKPLETMDDGFIATNIYYNKKLVLTEITTIPLLKEYINQLNKIKNRKLWKL
jgi:hypothetical protein